jgi:hypothetical protein
MFKRNWIACLFLVVFGIAACASPPQQLIEQARKSMEDAKAAGAEMYAPDAMAKATEEFNAAEAEIAAQSKKFAASRNYKVAMEKFQASMASFEQAKLEATSAKETMKAEVDLMMKDATAVVDATEQAMAKIVASRPKMDLTQWQNEVAGLRQGLTDASTAISSEDYITAKAKIQSAMTKATEIQSQLQQAMARGSAK